MARKPRIDFPGAWHHVTHRGARKEPIFFIERHCQQWCDLLQDTVAALGLEVHAFALLPNHYHLLVRSVRGNLSRAMRHLNRGYSRAINRERGWDGPLLRDRFRSQLITDEKYLREVLLYIHLNPVRAHLVKRPDDPWWSSHCAYIDEEPKPDWLTTGELLPRLGGSKGLVRAIEKRQQGADPWPAAIDRQSGWIRGLALATKPAPKVEPDALLRKIAEHAGVSPFELLRSRSGAGANPARRFAVWALSHSLGLPHREIGKLLEMSTYQVGNVLRRLRAGPRGEIACWMSDWQHDAVNDPG